MRKLLLSLTVLAVGVAGAFLAFSPRANAHGLLAGTFNGSVGSSGNPNAFVIALDTPSSIAAGTYQFNITDYATIHNFDLCQGTSCTGSNSLAKTSVNGTGSVQWTLTLGPGTYTYWCDVHTTELMGQFTVTGTLPLNGSVTSVKPTRKLVTVAAKANQTAHFKAWLLKGSTQLATTGTVGTTATLKLKPAKTLQPGFYTVQVRIFTSPTAFKVIRKKIKVT